MKNHQQIQQGRRRSRARIATTFGIAVMIAAPGCKRDDAKQDSGNTNGDGSGNTNGDGSPPAPCDTTSIESVDPALRSAVFAAPLDAVPSPDGTEVYFTAFVEAGAAILRGSASGGEPTILAAGAPLIAPFGIAVSSDGGRVFVVDSASEEEGDRGLGRIFSLSTAGGTALVPAALTEATGTRPRGLDLVKKDGADRIYFTGFDAADGEAAIFSIGIDGTSRTLILKGAPLSDPSGIAVASDGTVYVADTGGGEQDRGALLKIASGNATELAGGLRLGHPAGIALSKDESAILISALDPVDGSAVLHKVILASGAVSTFTQGISENHDSAGLHRAHNANVFAWANAAGDTKGEAQTAGGIVYVLRGKELSACP